MEQLGYSITYALPDERVNAILRYLEKSPRVGRDIGSSEDVRSYHIVERMGDKRAINEMKGRILINRSSGLVKTYTLLDEKTRKSIDKLARKISA